MSATTRIEPSSRRCRECGQSIPPDATHGFCPACLLAGALSPDAAPTPPAPGRRLGDFELIEELGRGGMGVVWRARQISLGREVALKMILWGSFASESERRRFQLETQAAAALNHPNIVPVLETNEWEGQPYYAMRLLQDGSLAERLARGPLAPREAVTLAAKIAAGVHHAHQHGILHRDLKPANVLLDGEEPLIADFGLAKRLGSDADPTLTGSVLGSPHYMAPEQAAGQTSRVSTATDIYSLGAILYHSLTGRPPFQADTPLATLKLVLESEPLSPRTRQNKVDRDLEKICLKCLAKDPAGRYPSADALREDLERWLRREPVRARRAPLWERWWKWTRRHPAIAAAAGAIVGTAALGLAVARLQHLQTKAALDQANRNALAERSARAQVIEASEMVRLDDDVKVASLSPDGRQVLLASGTNAFIRDFAGGRTLHRLAGHTSYIRLGAWSGDGRRVITASTCQQQPVWSSPLGVYGDQTVRVWEAGTGRPAAVFTNGFAEPLSSVAINTPGDMVALASVDGQLGVWRVGQDAPLFTTQASTSQVLQVRFSPDDARVFASSAGYVYWILRPHPGGGTYGSQSFHEENLALAFDLNGRIRSRLANDSTGKVLVQSNLGLHRTPELSSRATFEFSPDGRFLATAAAAAANSAVWDLATGRRLFTLPGLTQGVEAVAFSPDGRWLAAGSADGTARVWAARTGLPIALLEPHPREVIRVAFASDPRWLLTVCADKLLRIWDVERRVCVAALRGHRDQIRSAEFSKDGEEVISGSADRTFRRWRWATFEQMAVPLARQNSEIKSIRFAADGQRVVTGAAHGAAQVCETARGRLLLTLHPRPDYEGHSDRLVHANQGGEMRDAVFLPGDRRILTVRSDPKVTATRNPLAALWPGRFPPKPLPFLPGRLWDAADGREVAGIPGSRVAFVGVEVRADGRRALLRGDDYPRSVTHQGVGRFARTGYSHGGQHVAEAVLWDLEQHRPVAQLDAGPGSLRRASFEGQDGRLLTATETLVQVWSAEGAKPRAVESARGRDWTAFSPQGDWLLSEDADGYPALWDGAQLAPVRHFERLGTNVWEAWFAQGGQEVGLLTEDGRLATVDRATGAPVWEGTGSGRNTALTKTSADGRWLATVVDGHQVDLWDLQAHRLARTIERHVHPITALEFSADGRWIGTGDRSGEVWLWPLRLATFTSPEADHSTAVTTQKP